MCLSDQSARFREHVLRFCDRYTPLERFWYIDRDTVAVVCPLCDAALGIYFAGSAPWADLRCSRGCNLRGIALRISAQAPQGSGDDELIVSFGRESCRVGYAQA